MTLPNPFLPDYIQNICTNSKPAESWMDYTTLPKTPRACCQAHFSWAEMDCNANTQIWLFKNNGGGGNEQVIGDLSNNDNDGSSGGDAPVYEYPGIVFYPDTTLGTCKIVNDDKASWITTIEVNYKDCCNKWFGWNVQDCLDSVPKLLPKTSPTTNANADGGGKTSGGGGGGATSGTIKRTKPPTKQPISRLPPTSKPTKANKCDGLNRQQCIKMPIQECQWVYNQFGIDYCANPYLNALSSSATSTNINVNTANNNQEQGSATSIGSTVNKDCSTYKKTVCLMIHNCIWNKKQGCLNTGGGSSGGSTTTSGGGSAINTSSNYVGGGSLTSFSGGGGSSDPCLVLAYGECNSSPSCTWNGSRSKCQLKGTVSESTTTAASKLTTANAQQLCQSYTKEQCITHHTCIYNKKSGCSSVPQPTPSPTARPTSHPIIIEYYLDTSDGMCKVNNNINRPTWLNQIFGSGKECCKVSWDENGCLKDLEQQQQQQQKEVEEENDLVQDQLLPTNEDDYDYDYYNEEPTLTTQQEYYYDTGSGTCQPNSTQRPSWITQIYTDITKCCINSWDVPSCIKPYEGTIGKEATAKLLYDTSLPPIYIDLSLYGSLHLSNLGDVPNQTSKQFNKLKRALTKSIILTMADCWYVHDEYLEVMLWSLDDVEFTWRHRYLMKDGELDDAEDDKEAEDDEETEVDDVAHVAKSYHEADTKAEASQVNAVPVMSPSLRGTSKVTATSIPQSQEQPQQQAHQGQQHQPQVIQQKQRKLQTQELKFELIIPTICNYICQSDTYPVPLGTRPFNAISAYYQNAISDGTFTIQFKTAGESMGIFNIGQYPAITSGTLSLTSAIQSSRSITSWSPSKSPTLKPTDVTPMPTEDVYYADTTAMKCISSSTDGHSKYNVHFFGSLEECCAFPWMQDYDECIVNSKLEMIYTMNGGGDAAHKEVPVATPRPTMSSTPRPTSKKKNKTKRPTSAPTNAANVIVQVIYYPDLTLGVCKFDGQHGNTPYQFSTPQACCTNQWMDYTKCMTYADPYAGLPTSSKYYPDIYEGYCKSDGKHEGWNDQNNLVFDTPEACCDNVWMEYQSCMIKSRDPPKVITNEPTNKPTISPVKTTASVVNTNVDPKQVTGKFYPDFEAGNLCRSDIFHQGKPYVFDTLHACCTNAIMDYNICVSNSLDIYDVSGLNVGSDEGGSSLSYDGCTWYPDPAKFGTCTYSSKYPKIWESPSKRDKYLFSTHGECCLGAFGGPGCAQDYDCNGLKAGPTPTGYVTQPPSTYYPTFNPTSGGGGNVYGGNRQSPPTNKPTPNPTPMPTRQPIPMPTPPPTSGVGQTPNPTPKPVVEAGLQAGPYVPPTNLKTAIDATSLTYEVSDSFENGLSGGFPWVTTPELPWATYDQDKTEGRFSARSHPVGPGESSDLSVAIKSNHGGKIYFDFKSDVKMPYSGCYINIDNESKKGYTFPKAEWMELSLDVPAGDHVVMFRVWAPNLVRPNPNSLGVSGTIGVDNVSFMPKLFEGFEGGGKLEWPTAQFVGTAWSYDISKAHEGSVSLKSPTFSSKGTSTLKFEVTVPRRGAVLNFWYNSQVSGARDRFAFKINGNVGFTVNKADGTWQQFSKSLSPGRYTLEWVYASEGVGAGSLWLDDIGIVGK